jgi:hypothetical protein
MNPIWVILCGESIGALPKSENAALTMIQANFHDFWSKIGFLTATSEKVIFYKVVHHKISFLLQWQKKQQSEGIF